MPHANEYEGIVKDGPRETSIHDRLDELGQRVDTINGMTLELLVALTGEKFDSPTRVHAEGAHDRLTQIIESAYGAQSLLARIVGLVGRNEADSIRPVVVRAER